MNWNVNFSRKALKQITKLNKKCLITLRTLVACLEIMGPIPGKQWPNYSKLKGRKDLRHCHLIKGNPTYVCCWEVIDKQMKILEIYYVGTHEKAPY